ncbi:hypothetical protein PMJ10TS2_18350 [Paenibacillus melissococcoides]
MKKRFLQKGINFVLIGLDLKCEGGKDVDLHQFHPKQLPNENNPADLQDSSFAPLAFNTGIRQRVELQSG